MDSRKLIDRRKLEFQRRCKDILIAAEVVMAKRGVHKATMEEIASQCGFAVGSLYRYFKNKKEIYSSLFQTRTEVLALRTQEIVKTGKPSKEKLAAVLDAAVDFFDKHRLFFMIFNEELKKIEEQPYTEKVKDQDIYHYHRQFIQNIEKIFSEAIKTSGIRHVNVKSLTLMFVGMLESLIRESLKKANSKNLQIDKKLVLEIMSRGIQLN